MYRSHALSIVNNQKERETYLRPPKEGSSHHHRLGRSKPSANRHARLSIASLPRKDCSHYATDEQHQTHTGRKERPIWALYNVYSPTFTHEIW
jgi:hypothetical protein